MEYNEINFQEYSPEEVDDILRIRRESAAKRKETAQKKKDDLKAYYDANPEEYAALLDERAHAKKERAKREKLVRSLAKAGAVTINGESFAIEDLV